jgi:hypothetical protein
VAPGHDSKISTVKSRFMEMKKNVDSRGGSMDRKVASV